MEKDPNIEKCFHCGKTTCFEHHDDVPISVREYEVCSECEDHICPDCMDVKYMNEFWIETPICKKCVEIKREKIKNKGKSMSKRLYRLSRKTFLERMGRIQSLPHFSLYVKNQKNQIQTWSFFTLNPKKAYKRYLKEINRKSIENELERNPLLKAFCIKNP